VPPTELGVCIGRIAIQDIDLCRAKVSLIDFQQNMLATRFDGFFIHTATMRDDISPDMPKGSFDKFLNRMGLASW
jgi:hypothetical protein